jgi:hypothetical protein
VLDLIKQMYPKATTLADIGITKAREAIILQAISESYSVPQSNPEKEAKRKRLEAFVQETRASSGNSSEDDSQEHQRQKEEELETAFKEESLKDAPRIFLKNQSHCVCNSQKRLTQHQSLFGKRLIC